jgi:polyisoprenoid-binding protein YceI
MPCRRCKRIILKYIKTEIMKRLLSLLFVIVSSPAMFAQTIWKADPMHSHISFSTTHLGIAEIGGLFKIYEVTAIATKADFSDAAFELSIDVASIDTEIEMRDKHLRSAEFLDVAKYPKTNFKSTSITKSGKDRYNLKGNLTLHGITRAVTMELWYRGTVINTVSKAPTAGFQLTGTIKRSEFGIGANFPPPGLSDVVSIRANGEFIRK